MLWWVGTHGTETAVVFDLLDKMKLEGGGQSDSFTFLSVLTVQPCVDCGQQRVLL